MNRARKRGTASVEGVIVLPVFVILFVGIFFVRDLTNAKLAADEEARRCAWEYSKNNCDHVPSGCENVLSEARGSDIDLGEVGKSLGEIENNLSSDGFKKILKDILIETVVKTVTDAFTKKLEANKAVERERPNLFGGGKSQIVGRYRLACNLQPYSQGDMVDKAWDLFMP